MVKRAYPGTSYAPNKRRRYMRRRRAGRRYVRRATRRSYTRGRIRGVGELKAAHGTATANLIIMGDPVSDVLRMEQVNIIPRGPNNNQRIGNTIGPAVVQFRYSIDMHTGGVANVEDFALYIRCFVVQLKGMNLPVASELPPVSAFFMEGAVSPLIHIAPFRDGITSFCHVLYDRVHHFDDNSSTSSIIKKLRFNVRDLKWGANTPDDDFCDNPVLAYFIAVKGSPSAGAASVQSEIKTIFSIRYRDA